jgi:hypothetical protein
VSFLMRRAKLLIALEERKMLRNGLFLLGLVPVLVLLGGAAPGDVFGGGKPGLGHFGAAPGAGPGGGPGRFSLGGGGPGAGGGNNGGTYILECPIPLPKDAVVERGAYTVTLAIRPNGQVFWNGTPVQHGGLPKLLAQTVKSSPEAILHLYAPDNTPYGMIKNILRVIDRSGIRHLILGSPRGA